PGHESLDQRSPAVGQVDGDVGATSGSGDRHVLVAFHCDSEHWTTFQSSFEMERTCSRRGGRFEVLNLLHPDFGERHDDVNQRVSGVSVEDLATDGPSLLARLTHEGPLWWFDGSSIFLGLLGAKPRVPKPDAKGQKPHHVKARPSKSDR